MLFGFRGVRGLQAILALACAGLGVGAVILLKLGTEESGRILLLPAALLGLAFLWAFGITLRLPTSFVAVGDDRTRVRMGGLADVVVMNRDIVDARLVRHRWWEGLGLRTNFAGMVALATAPGQVAEIHLREPVRFWAIPRLLPVRASRVRLSVRNPQKLVERFAASEERSVPQAGRGRRRR